MFTRKSLLTALMVMCVLGFMPATTTYAITLAPTTEAPATTTTSSTTVKTKVTDVTTTTVTTVTETTHTVTTEETVTTDKTDAQSATPTAAEVTAEPKTEVQVPEATNTQWVEKRLSKPTFKTYKKGQKKLKWKKVQGADYYELWFYNQKNDKFVGKVEAKGNSFNLSEIRKVLTKKQRKLTYCIKIYAFSNNRNVTRSGASTLRNVTVNFTKKDNSTKKTKKYSGYSLVKKDGYMYYTNGKEKATGWVTISDMQYYFDEKGRMQFCIFIK